MARFETGPVFQTRRIATTTEQHPDFFTELAEAYQQYAAGNWGVLTELDKEANEEAIKNGGRILARYNTSHGDIYIITEADRSATTILFRDEY